MKYLITDGGDLLQRFIGLGFLGGDFVLLALLGLGLLDAAHVAQSVGHFAREHSAQVTLNDDGGAVHLQELETQAATAEEPLQDQGGAPLPQEPLPLAVPPPNRLDQRRRSVDDVDAQRFQRLVHLQAQKHFPLTNL